MERTMIAKLREVVGQQVMIKGWLQTVRDQKKMQFLVVRDPSGAVQVVIEKGANPAVAEIVSRLASETAVVITGKAIDNPIVKLGGVEIQLETLEIAGESETPLPLDPFSTALPSIDFRLDWRYLDLRRPENLLLFKVQTTAEMAMRSYWGEQQFIEIHSPKLMGSPSESGAELFELPYFETKAYLAQSPQFYKQMAIAGGLERVFEVGPVFRADPSFTARHMTEFTSIDMEMGWISSQDDVMAFMEGWLHHIYRCIADQHRDEIRRLYGVEVVPPTVPFPRVTMAEALEILKSAGSQLPPEKKGDLDPGGERAIGKWVKEKYGHDFVYLTDWPVAVRPFYHMRHPDQPGLTRSFDLLIKGLEISTGAQREHRPEILAAQAREKGLSLEPIQFYLDFFRYGCPPHGGFGFGLARFLMVLLGISNIRETVFLFRGPNRLQP